MGKRSWAAEVALSALAGAMLLWPLGCSRQQPTSEPRPPTAAPTSAAREPADEAASSSAPEPSAAEPEHAAAAPVRDTLVLFLYRDAPTHEWLQQIRVHDDGSITWGPEVPLPTLPDAWYYSGPLATSPDSCLLISSGGYSKDIIAYQWRVGQAGLVQIGSLCQSFYHDWSLEAVSYSRLLGHALVAQHAPEGLLDPPVVWVLGSESWSRLPQAYPALHHLDNKRITTARYSPDGSLLAVAASRKGTHEDAPPVDIFLLDLRSGAVRTFAGPRQYVWDISISPDNRELRWYDTGYAAASAEFETTGDGPQLDEYHDSGTGVISLTTGETSYARLADQRDRTEPSSVLTGYPGDRLGVHSHDGERLYYLSSGLIYFDRSSRQFHRLLEKDSDGRGHLGGFAILPPQQETPAGGVDAR